MDGREATQKAAQTLDSYKKRAFFKKARALYCMARVFPIRFNRHFSFIFQNLNFIFRSQEFIF